MSVISHILAVVIMGTIALFLIAVPLAISMPIGTAHLTFAPFLAVALLTVVIDLWAPTARIALGRLCVLNGLAGFALPLQGILYSALNGPALDIPSATDPAVKVGLTLGVGLFGTALTGALGFVGIFIGLIFIIAGYFVLRDAPSEAMRSRGG